MQIKCCIYLSIAARKHQDQGSLQNRVSMGLHFQREESIMAEPARTNKRAPPLTAGGRHGSRTGMLRALILKDKQEAEKMSSKCFHQ